MKLSTKPISSPGRTEKFPPPLMRFLRTNVGSKSRGRSRSSPMFVRKKNTASAIETQEPSSPKVTCMGQVRVRRSSKQDSSTKPSKARRTGTPVPAGCRCRWIPRALFCHHFAGKLRPKLCRPVWSKWASYFQVSFRRKVETREEPSKLASRFEEKNEDSEEEDEDEDDEKEEAKVFVSSCSPPKNALILTRCRSAPYRSSSLACRFWGSPLKPEEEEEQSTEVENRDDCSKNEKPKSELESLDPETEEKLQIFRESDGSNGKIFSESANTDEEEESKTGEGDLGFGRPLILTRCKSEPARPGEKVDPELSFWKNRRLGIVNSCSPSVL
ncbi:protamine P1 family protein [Parasponia andersonii]|uniref:Protamine P1 family protein n=1 Tax=Parasponia andersonii TaxID=3476 RepID=A0A2P5D7H6_PARAD|nr:protamine P1 family protein [Parasponia andersonii]